MNARPIPGPLGFLPLGVGDAFSARFYASSLLVGFNNAWLLVDCPHPIRKMLCEASESAGMALDLDVVDAVILTHLHADHCSGVEGLLYFNHFALQRKPTLMAHDDVLARLWPNHLAGGMGIVKDPVTGESRVCALEDYAEIETLAESEELRFGSFSISCRKTLHPIPTTALKIRAGGRCLGYSADTAFDPTLIEWLGDADVIVHETNLGIHTPYERLIELPEEVRARMRLIHYPDDFELEGSQIEPLREGRWYAV